MDEPRKSVRSRGWRAGQHGDFTPSGGFDWGRIFTLHVLIRTTQIFWNSWFANRVSQVKIRPQFSPPATNDIGIITLPDGRHLAVAAFVSDSAANDDTRDAIIARLAKAAWDRVHSLGRGGVGGGPGSRHTRRFF